MCFEWLNGNMSQQVKYGWCDLYSDEVVTFSDNFSFVSLLLIFADETFIAFSVTALKIYNGIFYTLHTYFRFFLSVALDVVLDNNSAVKPLWKCIFKIISLWNIL